MSSPRTSCDQPMTKIASGRSLRTASIVSGAFTSADSTTGASTPAISAPASRAASSVSRPIVSKLTQRARTGADSTEVRQPQAAARHAAAGCAKVGGARSRRRPRGARMSAADENLKKIDHIVVLMMENRSFDHMLGFLTLEQGRTDVDGPTRDMTNEYRDETYRVHRATSTKLVKAQDPCHSGWCVDEQLANDSAG